VPGVGIEPTRPFWDLGILSYVRRSTTLASARIS